MISISSKGGKIESNFRTGKKMLTDACRVKFIFESTTFLQLSKAILDTHAWFSTIAEHAMVSVFPER